MKRQLARKEMEVATLKKKLKIAEKKLLTKQRKTQRSHGRKQKTKQTHVPVNPVTSEGTTPSADSVAREVIKTSLAVDTDRVSEVIVHKGHFIESSECSVTNLAVPDDNVPVNNATTVSLEHDNENVPVNNADTVSLDDHDNVHVNNAPTVSLDHDDDNVPVNKCSRTS